MITSYSSLLSIDVCDKIDQNQLGGGESYFSLYVTVQHKGKTQTGTEIETMKEFCLLACPLLLHSDSIFLYSQDKLPKDGKTHSGACYSISVNNQENFPTACPQANYSFSFPLLR